MARAYLHFRSGDPDAATDVLARPGAVTGDEIRAAVILRARILAGGGELRTEHLELGPTPLPGAAGTGPPLELNPRQSEVLEGLAEGQCTTSTEHADGHGISTRTALRDLVELVEMGHLVREGKKRGTRIRRVSRASAGQ